MTGKAIVAAGTLGLKLVKKLDELGATTRIQEAWEIEARSWRANRDAKVEERLAQLEANATDQAAFAAACLAMLEDSQFLKVQQNLVWEAQREALAERRTMLAYAAAGLSDPNVEITRKARVERTLRELDPEHVELLDLLYQQKDPPFVVPPEREHHRSDLRKEWEDECAKRAEGRFSIWNSRQPGGHILQAAGCVHVQQARNLSGIVKLGVTITALGVWVLEALDGFVAAQKVKNAEASAR